MFKTIFKEILIMILLIAAIILILGIVLYDYNPTIKKIPTATYSYTSIDTAEEELQETLEAAQSQNIIQTYTIDGSDLAMYEKTKDYDKGRINPFDSINSTTTGTGAQAGSSPTGSGSSSTDGSEGTEDGSGSTSNSSSTSSQGRFLNEVK